MTVEELLKQTRAMWGDKPMSLEHVALALGVVLGDIFRQARNRAEDQSVDEAELKKELGNLISSTIRMCDDLGYDVNECLELSKQAQIRYVQKYLGRKMKP